jgi:4-hydroxybenzoate polyprenyltransferase
MNDLADINSDRLHVEKRRRPFASGNLPLWWGAILIPVLLFVAFGISAFLPIGFGVTLLLYFFANILYSFKLKQVHSLDLILLAGMYTARLFAGGEATSSRITPWLAAFSIFFFVGLAAVKRFTEISKMLQRKVAGRGYYQDDKLVVLGIGIGSSLLSPLVLALYLNSPQVSNLYTHPTYLWILMPVLLFWIFRIWVAAGRGEVRSDPVLHAIKDKQSYLVAIVSLLCVWMAI